MHGEQTSYERSWMATEVKADPMAGRIARWEEIRVRVERGVVTLVGDVSSGVARQAADDDAWATPGVVDVRNHLRLVIHPVSGDGPRAA